MPDIKLKNKLGVEQAYTDITFIDIPSGDGTVRFKYNTGSINISTNGTHDVNGYDNAVVSITPTNISSDFSLKVGDQFDTLYFNTEHSTTALDTFLAGLSYFSTELFPVYPLSVASPAGGTLAIDLSALESNCYAIALPTDPVTVLYVSKTITYDGVTYEKGWQMESFYFGTTFTVTDIDSGFKNIKDTYISKSAETFGHVPVYETVNVTPTTSAQNITPTNGYDGIDEINVAAVTSSIDSNIKSSNIITGKTILGVSGSAVVPSGTIRYEKNGDYDITSYKNLEVRVPEIMSDTLIRLSTYKNYTAIFDIKQWGSGYELCLTTSNNPVALYPSYGDNTAIGKYGNVGGWRNHTLNNRTPVESVNVCIKANSSGTISSVIVTLFTSTKNGIEFLYTGSQLNGAVLSIGNQNRIDVRSDIGLGINNTILNVPTTFATFDYGLKDNSTFTGVFYEFRDINTNNLYLHSGNVNAVTGAVYSLQTEIAGNYPGVGSFATGTLSGWQDGIGTITDPYVEAHSINGTACTRWVGTIIPNAVTSSSHYLTGHLNSIHSTMSQGYIYFQLGVARDNSSKNPYCLYDLKLYE